MIDQSKRKTLKTLAVASGTIATGGVSAAVPFASADQISDSFTSSDTHRELGQIEVTTRPVSYTHLTLPTNREV